MKRNLILILIAAAAALATGCTSPSVAAATSRITYVRKGNDVTFTYDTPKDNVIRSFKLKKDPVTGELGLEWDYSGSSVNEEAVKAAHADALARARLIEVLAQTVPAALGRAPAPAPAP